MTKQKLIVMGKPIHAKQGQKLVGQKHLNQLHQNHIRQ